MQRKTGLEDCIRHCWETRHLCQTTLFGHCLPSGGEHVAPAHVELMLSCIEICQAAADSMTRTSACHASVCSAAANICDALADSCEAILCGETPCVEMQRLADACRICAAACRTTGQDVGIMLTDVTDVAAEITSPPH